ncbi:hypothetical protein ABB37_01879 [Leptomonas pyrrhocoris]|uniref:FHA domain-containing protein n=1 Tax=Leptomonas pyrrhocoris TaxID=157538 RepID=A0A0M9G6Z0_LEPPY|nr:hypothetical protein ABB37_01879 [Leptomonas pyrrhocoris]XP_015662038.1 hypothetical protein ABB37_01879 [Leptomonas pyrrhocoris]KPA83598.1 hypothetical protein ABB37_01879 [Leptomonas pyrrhocoris]KPA83599.1 hypothetical protein ABB37_01879 [Leptomonas pyrrhocoris]|eukprot:XP_015662037.1 hypothetical protein ABB37_01879 [Leptomonas pyrrhocoris]
MPTHDFMIDLVLVRGPASLDRRLHVRLPRNGTPITVGRATHCTTLLDPSLLFSSQVQCSLFAMPVKTASTPAVPPPVVSSNADATPDNAAGAAAVDLPSDVRTPAHQATHTPDRQDGRRGDAALRVYITDMCSSNGTFVNGLRISGTDPTELQHGDVCVFGGMRDVEVGEALPADAYAGPELVLWRVDMGLQTEVTTHDFDFTATPLVLPATDVLAAEVRALMSTAQRSLRGPQGPSAETGFSATPAAQRPLRSTATAHAATDDAAGCVGDGDGKGGHEDSPYSVPQRLFTSPALRVVADGEEKAEEELAAVAAARRTIEGSGEVKDGADRRSVSLVAITQEADDDTPPPAHPPAALHYRAVRVGNVTFTAAATTDVVDAVREDRGAKLPRTEADADVATRACTSATTPTEPPPLLTCTAVHLKWTMPNPNDLLALQQGKRGSSNDAAAVNPDMVQPPQKKPFYGMLAVTSLSTVLACVARRGIAVELKDGCQLPLVDEAVLNGSAESRWVVWMLAPDMKAAAGGVVDAAHGSAVALSGSGHGTTDHHGGPATRKGVVRGGRRATAEPTQATQTQEDAAAASQTPEERFEAWVQHFQQFYRERGLPPPHLVDAATFDLIFAPPLSPW